MTNKELRSIIRKHNGPIFVTVCGNDDVHFIRVVKSSLLREIETVADNELEARITYGDLYIDRANV